MPGHPGACFFVASACASRSRERSGLRHLWYVCVRSFSDLTASALLLSPRAGRAFLMDPATCCPAPQTRDDASRLATTVIVEGPSSRVVASPSGSQCPVRQRYYARVTTGTIICVNGMVVIGVASSRRARWSAAIGMSEGSRFRCRLAYRADVSKSPLAASAACAATRRSMLRRKTARIGDGLSARYPAATSITGALPVSGRLTNEAGSSAFT